MPQKSTKRPQTNLLQPKLLTDLHSVFQQDERSRPDQQSPDPAIHDMCTQQHTALLTIYLFTYLLHSCATNTATQTAV